MTESLTLTTAQPERQTLPPGISREEVLHKLLPYDYDYAQQQGLIDMFYYDEKTGKDGLLHTLSGDLVDKGNGVKVPEGFHHEPSAAIVWQPTLSEEGVSPTTWVDRSEYPTMNAKKRAFFKEYPLDPYAGRVVIDGLVKYAVHAASQTTSKAKNQMFPKEYDPLMVMQTVRNAYLDRDVSQDQYVQRPGEAPVYVAESSSLLLDGETRMPIRLILDANDKRILSAIPLPVGKAGVMRLSDEQAHEIIYGKS